MSTSSPSAYLYDFLTSTPAAIMRTSVMARAVSGTLRMLRPNRFGRSAIWVSMHHWRTLVEAPLPAKLAVEQA